LTLDVIVNKTVWVLVFFFKSAPKLYTFSFIFSCVLRCSWPQSRHDPTCMQVSRVSTSSSKSIADSVCSVCIDKEAVGIRRTPSIDRPFLFGCSYFLFFDSLELFSSSYTSLRCSYTSQRTKLALNLNELKY
jgi:hypothetical protein